MKLSENIKNIRKAKGLRQEQLAEAMGVSTASVSKWETGQCAPELTVLMDLADYFEVSVDALMGHQISGNRVTSMLDEMEQLNENGAYKEAMEVAEKLLQCYPNSLEVVEKTASLYYQIYVSTADDKALMEKSIALTKRMFGLMDDKTGAKKFELLSDLGNKYEFLGDWEQARKCYIEGNVGKMNARALAGLLNKEGKDEEAIKAMSDVFVDNFYYLLVDILQMAPLWEKIGEKEKADAALLWACESLENMTGEAVAHLKPIKTTMYILLAIFAEERQETNKAEEFVKNAMLSVSDTENRKEKYDFLSCTRAGKIIGTSPRTPEMVVQMLKAAGLTRLAEVAEKTLNVNG